MPRAERLRLRRERDERLRKRAPELLLRTLFRQRDELLRRSARIGDLPELRALVRAARRATQPRFEFGGCQFIVRRRLVFSTLHATNGRHLVSFEGVVFDV